MNESVIATIAQQLKDVAGRIESISLSTEVLRANDSKFSETNEEFLIDEIGHAQILILELTRLVDTEHKNEDGSVFHEGELNETVEKEEPESNSAKEE